MWQLVAGLVLVAHGIGHLTGVIASWTSINPGFTDAPWVLPGDRKLKEPVGKAWSVFWVVSLVLFLVSGIGVLMSEEWWRLFAIMGAVTSIVAMAPWWNTIMAGAKAGILLDVAILLVLLLPWGEGIIDFFEVP